jgi:soluble lytic murein transglycosylase
MNRRAHARRRRAAWGGIAVLAGVILAFLIANGTFDHAIKELTLPLQHEDVIRQQAREKNVDAALIAAVIYAESKFEDQESSAGARGLMQITPDAAATIAKNSEATSFELKDLGNPEINIRYGTFLLAELIDRFNGNVAAALAAYNAGPANAEKWGGSDLNTSDIRFPETRAYVEGVLEKQAEYRDRYAKELGYR